MPRPLKVYRAHLGFYDTIIAAPSQKAAVEAWGASPTEFSKGFAKVTKDAEAVETAIAQPGVVLRRPAGSRGMFKAVPDAPVAPELTASQKRNAADAKRKVREKAKRDAEAAKRDKARRAAEAKAELTEIQAEESKLRERRLKLQRAIKT